jgi:hypothetical protein
MKSAHKLSAALFALLIFSTSVSFACSSDCGKITGITQPVTAITLMSDALHLTQSGIAITSHAGCAVVKEASNQVAAIPEAVNQSVAQAGNTTTSLFAGSLDYLQTAAGALISFSSSVLRIVFSSFSGLA